MNIALLTNGLHPLVVGGMQKHSYYLTKFLAQKKIPVDVYHIATDKDPKIQELDVFSEQELSYLQEFRFPFPSGTDFPGHYLWESYSYSEAIFESLRERLASYDLIYVQGFAGWKLLNEKSDGFATPPVFLNFHGLEMFQYATGAKNRWANFMMAYWVRKLLKEADYVQSLGGKLTDLLIHEGISLNNIVELPIGIAKSWLRKEPVTVHNPRKFVFIGRYERRKGVEELNQLLEELKDEHNFEFHFIGPIPEHLQVQDPRITYWGFINDSHRIRNLLLDMDILVCPSYSEGMPTVILEAMASGLAVLATDVGAVSKEVSTDNGWLIPPAELDVLRKTFLDTLEIPDDQLLDKKEHSIQKIRDRFIWNEVIERMIQAFQQQIDSHSK